MVSQVRTPLSNKSNQIQRRLQRAGKTTRTAITARTSCAFVDPPKGCQFKTTFSAKYYGAGTTTVDATQPLSVKCCLSMVKTVMARGTKSSVSSTLAITDCGIDFEDRKTGTAFHHIPIGSLFKIVPGTVVSKSGKTYTVVLVVAFDDAKPADQQPCHVFQCAHREDAAHMHAEVKRMWKDHIFSNLLDVSTEEGQQGFDSFMIRQDMATAAARCTELIADDAHEATDRCAKLMKAELASFDFLDMIAGMGDAPPCTPGRHE